MPVNVTLNLLTESAEVRGNGISRKESMIGHAYAALMISAPGGEVSIFTGDRLVLEKIAVQAAELANWLKSEADTKLLPKGRRPHDPLT